MSVDAFSLKQDYKGDWPLSNAREQLVLTLLGNMLLGMKKEALDRIEAGEGSLADRLLAEARLEARLTGLGAGSAELIGRTYRGVGEAFDITVMVDGEPCCYVEVTGVAVEAELKQIDGSKDMFCVGVWKLDKARRHKLLKNTWFAFVVGDIGKIRFIRASYLDVISEAGEPWAVYEKLRAKERHAICVDERKWIGSRRFYTQLRSAVKRFLITRAFQARA